MESYRISLRVFHPRCSHVEIIEHIGLDPAHAHSVGLERSSRDGALLGGNYRETYVSFPLTPKVEGYFVEGLHKILVALQQKATVLEFLVGSGGRCELSVGIFSSKNIGFTLTALDMDALSQLKLDVSISAYLEDE